MRIARLVATSILLGLALAGCSGGPVSEQEGAVVEEGRPSSTQQGPGAQTGQVRPPQVATVDLTAENRRRAADEQLKRGILASRSIYYDLDSYDVKDQFKEMVEGHARFLRDNPGRKILIQGNTDERGSREYNVALGQRRSDGVKRMMLLLGAREDQIESVSLGEEKPKAEGQGEQAWSQNRRSDILYQGEY
ncbi:MAG: peptidoglycan-associated lipoprotein Pal [Candidatus Parcubacteria bacterium]|nr:peptidoglycan-associated lipoprotein Pal [Burkholderiales bacterium]